MPAGSCKNICHRTSVKGVGKRFSYLPGMKSCRECGVMFETNNIMCECCNRRLGTGPRSKRYQNRLGMLKRM